MLGLGGGGYIFPSRSTYFPFFQVISYSNCSSFPISSVFLVLLPGPFPQLFLLFFFFLSILIRWIFWTLWLPLQSWYSHTPTVSVISCGTANHPKTQGHSYRQKGGVVPLWWRGGRKCCVGCPSIYRSWFFGSGIQVELISAPGCVSWACLAGAGGSQVGLLMHLES